MKTPAFSFGSQAVVPRESLLYSVILKNNWGKEVVICPASIFFFKLPPPTFLVKISVILQHFSALSVRAFSFKSPPISSTFSPYLLFFLSPILSIFSPHFSTSHSPCTYLCWYVSACTNHRWWQQRSNYQVKSRPGGWWSSVLRDCSCPEMLLFDLLISFIIFNIRLTL